MFERKKYFEPRQEEQPRLKRKKWETPSGMRAESVEFTLDSPEACVAVGTLR